MIGLRHRSCLALAALLAIGLFACKKQEDAAPTKAQPPKQTPPAKPAASAELTDPVCMSRWSEAGEVKALEAGGKTFQIKGTHATETSKDDDDQLVLGLVADTKEDTAENLANLDAILKFFKDSQAEAIVIDGDLGEDQKQIEAVLDKVSTAGLPVFAIIGNREGRTAFSDAMTQASSRHPNLVSLNKIRLVTFDDAALISVPGYHNKVYLHAEDGCLYSAADLEASLPIVQAAKGKPLVMVSHGPPKQEGADALDRTLEQVNVGDPALFDFIKNNGIKFGVFANIHEAGGRATNLTGQSLIPEGKLADELFVSIGPADSVRWTMNDGTESVGMASVLTIKGDKAMFKVLRLPKKAG